MSVSVWSLGLCWATSCAWRAALMAACQAKTGLTPGPDEPGGPWGSNPSDEPTGRPEQAGGCSGSAGHNWDGRLDGHASAGGVGLLRPAYWAPLRGLARIIRGIVSPRSVLEAHGAVQAALSNGSGSNKRELLWKASSDWISGASVGQCIILDYNPSTMFPQNEEKTEIEGTLFVYARSASPHHGFTIMNRLSTENLVEPINKDLEFQLQDPFLLYKNGNLGIYSIWFYDKRDCQRIAQLMVQIVKQEAEHAQRPSPERVNQARTNGASEPRPIDILQLLSKAKEEYHRAQAGDADVSTTAGPSVRTTVQPTEHHSTQADKPSHMVKQITVEELFGSSLPKEPALSSPTAPTAPMYLQNQSPHPQAPPTILPSAFKLQPNPVFQPVGPPHCPMSPLGSHAQPRPPVAFLGQEILQSLKPAAANSTDVHKPALAPSFLPSTLVPPQSFQEPMGKALLHNQEPPALVQPMSTLSMSPTLNPPQTSLLLSPSVFQQSVNKPPVASTMHTSVSEAPSSQDTQPTLCSKAQLQDTLVHLIKNDPDFLSAIHDAYLQSLSKDLSNLKL